MRTLLIVHSLRRGGAERVLLEIALGLRAKGHAAEVVSWLDVDEYQEERYRLIPRHYLMQRDEYRWPWAIPQAAVGFRKIAEQFCPDVVQIHTPTVSWVAAWARLSVPTIHVLHGYGSITRSGSVKDWVLQAIDRSASRRLDMRFVVVAPPMQEVAAAYFAADPSRLVCVPNGVDLSRFRLHGRVVRESPTVLMLGTLSPNKGQSWGVKAIKKVLKGIPEVRLIIVGEGSDRQALANLSQQVGVSDEVQFLGRREDVPDLLAAADVLWQLSESEGLPMVVIEAMATGLPVVGFDVRGTRDVVVQGESGLLVPFGDVEAVAQKTIDLLRDKSTYGALSLNARRRVEQNFSLESMVDGHERVLWEILKERQDEA